jgi:hypothetical protein
MTQNKALKLFMKNVLKRRFFVLYLLLLIFTGLCWREREAAEPATAVEECVRGAEIRARLLRFSLAALRQANGQCSRVALDGPGYDETKDNLRIHLFFFIETPRNSNKNSGQTRL